MDIVGMCNRSGKPIIRTTEALLLIFALSGAVPATRIHAQQPAQGDAASAEAKLVEQGKRNFVTYTCFACHGYSGQGSEDGPRIDTNRRPFPAFVSYVRKPGGSMPPFRTQNQISDTALTEIYAFLKSVPPPPDPKNIPLLSSD